MSDRMSASDRPVLRAIVRATGRAAAPGPAGQARLAHRHEASGFGRLPACSFPSRSADFVGGFLDGLVDVLLAHVEFLGDVLFGLQPRPSPSPAPACSRRRR